MVARWLAGISVLVLLIACANVANLLLARAAKDRRETGIRLALGSSRGRLIGQSLTESLLLAGLGAGAALLLTRWGGDLIRSVLLPEVEWADGGGRARLGVLVLALTLLSGLAAGLIPALQASRPELASTLNSGSRGSSGGASRTRSALTVLQAALSVLLLVGAGLFVRSLQRVSALDLGLDPTGVLLFTPVLDRDVDEERTYQFYRAATERVAALPGAEAVSPDASVPFYSAVGVSLRTPGLDSIPRLSTGGPSLHAVGPDYFRALDLEILRGRALEPADDTPAAAPVAIVNETMARILWPGEDALGKCLMVGPTSEEGVEPPCAQVVGVVENARPFKLDEEESMHYYLPVGRRLTDDAPHALLIAVRGDPASMIPTLQRELLQVDPSLRYAEVQPMTELLAPQTRPWTLGASVFTAFGALALLVAGIGLYSVLSFAVAQRTRELGIRAALGATRNRLMRMVFRQAIGLVALGIVVGVAVALLVGPRLQPLLYETAPRDPATFAIVAGTLLLVAVAAANLPAWRATPVDPGTALRAD